MNSNATFPKKQHSEGTHAQNKYEMEGNEWNSLPDVVLLEIYFLLTDQERYFMAQVCKNWFRIFNSPILWRKRRVIFGGIHSEKVAQRACGFVQTFGGHLRVLSVGFTGPSFRNVKSVSKSAEMFLKKLTYYPNLKLQEFTLNQVNMEHYWHFMISRNRVVSALCRFLRRLQHLILINMIAARFTLIDGCRVLESLVRGQAAKTLTTIFVEDMFQTNVVPVHHKRYVSAMSKFLGLRWIYTNYNAINGEILENFGRNVGDNLDKLTLTVDNNLHLDMINDDAWNKCLQNSPNVKVVIYLYASGFRQDVTEIFVPAIPLQEVDIVSWPALVQPLSSMEQQIPVLLRHIGCTYGQKLESLSLHMNRNSPMDEELLFLLSKCNRISDLNLFCQLKVSTVKRMCKMQKEGRIDLSSLNLAIHGLSEEEWKSLSSARNQLITAIGNRDNAVCIVTTGESDSSDTDDDDDDDNQ